MKRLMLLSVALLLVLPSISSAADDSDKNCKIVERNGPPPGGSGGLSTSVTASDGKVTAHTSGPNGVSVNSGNGSVSSSITTGSGSSHSQTVTTNSDGSCTIYRYREK